MPLNSGEISSLHTNIADAVSAAHALDVQASIVCCVPNGAEVFSLAPNREIIAASLSKLGVMRAVSTAIAGGNVRLAGLNRTPKQIAAFQKNGGGKFDSVDGKEAAHPTYATPDDMLIFGGSIAHDAIAESGNTAQAVIVDGVGGPQMVNQILHDLGYEHTRLMPLDKGGFYCGTTSAAEALRLFESYFTPENKKHDPTFDRIIRGALEVSSHTAGFRRDIAPIKPGKGYVVATKFGELDDYWLEGDVPRNLRHEVGRFRGPKGEVDAAVLTNTFFTDGEQKDTRTLERTQAAQNLVAVVGRACATAVGLEARA